MKNIRWLKLLSIGLAISGIGLSQPWAGAEVSPNEEAPEILGIQIETDEVVTRVWVPVGVHKVTLETRPRLGTGAWVPRKVIRLNGEGGEVEFRIPRNAQAEMIRVRADNSEDLPTSFYQGESDFNGPVTDFAPAPEVSAGAGPEDALADRENGGSSDVVESDIYYLDGNTLYFFNQYRGLQVIDVTDPEFPVVVDTYSIPAAGEDMYLLDSSHVILLARDGCGWGASGPMSQLLLLNVENGVITPVGNVPIDGSIMESRLVGDSLFVAAQTYKQVSQNPETSWIWGVQTQSFDLSDVNEPVAVDSTWTEGYGNVVYATSDYFFVGVQGRNWRDPTTVYFWDISAGDGSMEPKGSLRSAGRVADKFKMNYNGATDVFTMISEARDFNGENQSGLRAVVETVDLSNPDEPDYLGSVEVGHGESLFATRFDGDKAYIVTFLRIDPLWIVDLSDPANLVVSGELEVPGWSNYIHPMGDQLLTVGIDDVDGFRVAISLFDVSDPAAPGLLSKVSLGDNHSWSEANYDEKAFTVLEDQGLALVPFQGDVDGSYSSQVQLIDISGDTLTARGVIPHEMTPRRAVAMNDYILSISGRELLVVSAEDLDEPEILSETELSWNIEKLAVYGDYLIEVQDTAYYAWNKREAGKIRLVSQSNPDISIASITLERSLPIVGLTVKNDVLYVVQSETYDVWWWWGPVEDPAADEEEEFQGFVMTSIDLSNAPELSVLGSIEVESEPLGWNVNLTPHWMNDETLVWSGGGDYGYFMMDIAVPVGDAIGRGGFWGGGAAGNRFLAIDVTDPVSPVFASELKLEDNNGWWGAGETLTANQLLYISHQSSEYIPGVQDEVFIDEEGNEVIKRQTGYWMQKHYMNVVDYSDPYHPTLREEVDLPGALKGLSHQGSILYTVGYHYDELGRSDWSEWLDALAYDGVEAALIDSKALPTLWPHPVYIDTTGLVAIGSPGQNGSPHSLVTMKMDAQGVWKKLDQLTFDQPISQLRGYEGSLLIGQIQNSLVLIDTMDPSDLKQDEIVQNEGCIWFDLSLGVGSREAGVWIPLSDYGVFGVQLEMNIEE